MTTPSTTVRPASSAITPSANTPRASTAASTQAATMLSNRPSTTAARPASFVNTRVVNPGVELLTYQYGDKMVWTRAGKTYEEAMAYVMEAFPELNTVDQANITLDVYVDMAGKKKRDAPTVRIMQSSWPIVVQKLKTYDVVLIGVQLPVDPAKSESLPSYALAAGSEKRSDGLLHPDDAKHLRRRARSVSRLVPDFLRPKSPARD
ncbi:hypothetical protein FA95DRAFT_1562441 [Auriscalpium vulgare]|uniref:Uncharacterized protein n=1 Tax=Auriscalpium vulgare TaxID=40419 RepID=A0ACB8RK21_9AGAM|nr:hypothetical protein FA95DRAFT_1562441 [Auriscalpium vulgare]